MDIPDVWQALADAADAVEDLNCLGFSPDSIPEPCFYPRSVEITPSPLNDTRDDAVVTCRLLVSRADDKAGQQLLNEYLSRTGPRSVRAALLAARPLMVGGRPHDLRVLAIQAYGQYLIGGTYYLGAEMPIAILES